jgi:hypothetical protein
VRKTVKKDEPMNSPKLSRRTLLRGAGVALALPFLDATARAFSLAPKRRMVAVNLGLGLHGPHFFPEAAGRDYAAGPYLQVLQDFRNDLTVLSGVSHPSVDGGHLSEKSFLTTAPHPAGAGFKNSISLDQFAAMKLGLETRFGFLSLSTGGRGLSWSRSGVLIPSETRPSRVFAKLFLEGKPEEKLQQVERLKEGESVLDAVREQVGALRRRLGAADGTRLDEYTEALRETEGRLLKAEAWEDKPKPAVDAKPPRDNNDSKDVTGRARLMYDIMFLALKTDSTRFLTFFENGANAVPPIVGVTQDYHNLSHHGLDPAKIKELGVVETDQMKAFGEFLAKLKGTKEGDASLLDLTMVLFGSNLGNASSHDSRNLPVLLAGGGFRHGQHLAFDRDRNYPLGNLFVSMLRRLGIEADSFGSSTGAMKGLEPA